MPRKEFEMIVAQAPREKLVTYEKDLTTTVAAGLTEDALFYSDPGTISTIIGIYLNAPAVPGSTAGNHGFYLAYTLESGYAINMTKGLSAYSNKVNFNDMSWEVADDTISPNSDVVEILRGLQFDQSTPFRITYQNATDRDTAETRVIRLLVLQIQVKG